MQNYENPMKIPHPLPTIAYLCSFNKIETQGEHPKKLDIKIGYKDMIKNVMFDLGGVIMDIERERAVVALEAIGLNDADKVLGNYGQQGEFLQLERGEISIGQFFDIVIPKFSKPVSCAAVEDAFMKFLVGIPVKRLREIEALREKYGIYMLSNTNALMWDGFIVQEFMKDGHDLEYYFDGVVTSFTAHCYKPEPEIFLKAQRRFGIMPEETLFLDDSQANCEAAAKLGFKTAWVQTDKGFAEYLKEYGA